MDPLANPVWHALAGPQRGVAERIGGAARYLEDVAPFAALDDGAPPGAWEDLARILGPGAGALVTASPGIPVPAGWEELFRGTGVQLVARDDAPAGGDDGLRRLAGADVDAMLELVKRTRPGPFARRTIELGAYLGVFVDGQLAAMAGERMRVAGHVEISAVCTDPAFRRRGFAATLVRALMGRIRDRGERPFLHVAAENEHAIRLYEALGFERTRTLELCGARAPG